MVGFGLGYPELDQNQVWFPELEPEPELIVFKNLTQEPELIVSKNGTQGSIFLWNWNQHSSILFKELEPEVLHKGQPNKFSFYWWNFIEKRF
jgi:hypothetical protein